VLSGTQRCGPSAADRNGRAVDDSRRLVFEVPVRDLSGDRPFAMPWLASHDQTPSGRQSTMLTRRQPRPAHRAPDAKDFLSAATGTSASGSVLGGLAQVPLGIAGPIRINGEHAKGDFYIPMATTERTLVASYNRGMRLLTECGGVTATVVDDQMQRAPVFILDDALEGRHFGEWVDEHLDEITAAAQSTTNSGHLNYIGSTRSGRCATCRRPVAAPPFSRRRGTAAG